MNVCQYCGAKNPTGAAFCDGCGAALTSAVAAQAQASAQAQVAAAHAQATAQRAAVANPHASPGANAGASAGANAQAAGKQATAGTGRLPPQTLLRNGRYVLLKTVGRGGMAAVYQATDTKERRPVAIKEMSQDGLSPQELREAHASFTHEADLLKGLRHPNLPRVYEHFSERNRHYLVMEYIDGETLEQRLANAKGPLPEAEVLGWARQLCAALAYLHAQRPPIIFRDLKPGNIMLTRRGEVKLIDFGIARAFAPNRAHDTQALGTPGYAPPEQYGSAQTDGRADIYALGATLYHLLTNYDVARTPFALPPLRSRNPAITARTANAIERATQLNRDNRPATIGDFEHDLPPAPGQGAGWSAGQATAKTTAQPRQAPKTRPAAQASGQASGQAGPGSGGAVSGAIGAAAAGLAAATVAAIKTQLGGQGANATPGAAVRAAITAFAHTATGQPTATTQPREVTMGRLIAGQDGSATLTISGQGGAVVSGAIRPLAPWLSVDKTSFNGASTLVQVTARTSQIGATGPQQGMIEVSLGWQRMYVPVRLEVAPAPAARPPVNAAGGKGAAGLAGGLFGAARPQPQPKPQRQAAHQQPPIQSPYAPPSPYQAQSAQTAQAAPQGGRVGGGMAGMAGVANRVRGASGAAAGRFGGARLILSLALALLLAFGLPALASAFALPYVGAWLPAPLSSPLWEAWALVALGLLGGLFGSQLAYIRAAPSPGRIRTAALVGVVGATLPLTSLGQARLSSGLTASLPGAGQLGALALLLPFFVAVGAAVGAHTLVSRGILAVARYIALRYSLALVTAAIAGGWIGFTLAQTTLTAMFQVAPAALALLSGCGLIVGVALGLALASPVGFLVRRFASV